MEKEFKLGLGKLTAAIGGLITLVASVVTIQQYAESTTKYDINGEWTIETATQQTTYKAFEGLRETFKVNLTQNGTQFTGDGEKWSDQGQNLPTAAHTPLRISGTLDRSGRIHATFISQGALRQTSGGFDWQLSADGKNGIGSFTSTAADSSGTSSLRR